MGSRSAHARFREFGNDGGRGVAVLMKWSRRHWRAVGAQRRCRFLHFPQAGMLALQTAVSRGPAETCPARCAVVGGTIRQSTRQRPFGRPQQQHSGQPERRVGGFDFGVTPLRGISGISVH